LSTGAVVHICEGVPDTIALEAQGLPAVGVLGASSFRSDWVDMFMRFDVVLLPDGDSGGETFRQVTAELFAERGKAVRSVSLPKGLDVAEMIAKMGRKL
jgi:DNA primase